MFDHLRTFERVCRAEFDFLFDLGFRPIGGCRGARASWYRVSSDRVVIDFIEELGFPGPIDIVLHDRRAFRADPLDGCSLPDCPAHASWVSLRVILADRGDLNMLRDEPRFILSSAHRLRQILRPYSVLVQERAIDVVQGHTPLEKWTETIRPERVLPER